MDPATLTAISFLQLIVTSYTWDKVIIGVIDRFIYKTLLYFAEKGPRRLSKFCLNKYINRRDRGKLARNHDLESVLARCLRKTFEVFERSCKAELASRRLRNGSEFDACLKVIFDGLANEDTIREALEKLPDTPREAAKFLSFSQETRSKVEDCIHDRLHAVICMVAKKIPAKKQDTNAVSWLLEHARGNWDAALEGKQEKRKTKLAKTFIDLFVEEIKKPDERISKILVIDTLQSVCEVFAVTSLRMTEELVKIRTSIEKWREQGLRQADLTDLLKPQDFLGRDDQITPVEQALHAPGKPFVVLSGEFGVGKSAIAQMVYQYEHIDYASRDKTLCFDNRRWYADCSEQRSAGESVTRAVGYRFLTLDGINDDPGVISKAVERLNVALEKGRGLLVLDNADVFIRDDPMSFAKFCSQLRAECQGLSILITLRGSWRYALEVRKNTMSDMGQRSSLADFLDSFSPSAEYHVKPLPPRVLIDIFLRYHKAGGGEWERSPGLRDLIDEAGGMPELVVNWAKLSNKSKKNMQGADDPVYRSAQALLDAWRSAWKEICNQRGKGKSLKKDGLIEEKFYRLTTSYTELWKQFFQDENSRRLLQYLGFLPAGILLDNLGKVIKDGDITSTDVVYGLFEGLGVAYLEDVADKPGSKKRMRMRSHVRSLAARIYPVTPQRKELEDYIIGLATEAGKTLRGRFPSNVLRQYFEKDEPSVPATLASEAENFEIVIPSIKAGSLKRAAEAILGLGEMAFRDNILRVCDGWIDEIASSTDRQITADLRARAVVLRGHFAAFAQREVPCALRHYEDAHERFRRLTNKAAARDGFLEIAKALGNLSFGTVLEEGADPWHPKSAQYTIITKNPKGKPLRVIPSIADGAYDQYLRIRDLLDQQFTKSPEFQLHLAAGACNAITFHGDAQQWDALEEWGLRLQSIADKFSKDAEIQFALASGASYAIFDYGNVWNWEHLEKWGGRLGEVAGAETFRDDRLIQWRLAQTARNAIYNYGKAGLWDAHAKWSRLLNDIAARFCEDRDIQLELARSVLGTMLGLGFEERWDDLEEWDGKLKDLTGRFACDEAFQECLSSGALNAMALYKSSEHQGKEEAWSRQIKIVADRFPCNEKIQMDLVVASNNMIKNCQTPERWSCLEEWSKHLKDTACRFPSDPDFQLRLVEGAANAMEHYASNKRLDKLTPWGAELESVAGNFPDDAKIQYYMAKGASIAAECCHTLDKLKERKRWEACIKKIADAFPKNPAIQSQLAMCVVKALAYYRSNALWLTFVERAGWLESAARALPGNERIQTIFAVGASMVIDAYKIVPPRDDNAERWIQMLDSVGERFPDNEKIQEIFQTLGE